MKAREIKKNMLEQYELEINSFNRDLMRLEATEIKIRTLEVNLKHYFGIEKKYNFREVN